MQKRLQQVAWWGCVHLAKGFCQTSGFSSANIPVALLCLRGDWEVVCSITVALVLYTGGAWAGRHLPDYVYQSLLQFRQRGRFKISKKGLKPKHPLAGGYIMWMPVLCLSRLHGRGLGLHQDISMFRRGWSLALFYLCIDESALLSRFSSLSIYPGRWLWCISQALATGTLWNF